MIERHDTQRDLGEPLPARMINEYAYCPRLFYLEHVDGLFQHNADTLEGASRHRRVDEKVEALPKAAERKTVHARSVTLGSDALGVVAKLDLVESSGGRATPVDYKRGSPRRNPDGTLSAWDPERIQICVQGLLLREHGYACDEGVLFFWETRQRVRISLDDELIELTKAAIAGARAAAAEGRAPLPLVNSPKCPRCSLVNICMPDEVRASRLSTVNWVQGELFDRGLPAWGDGDSTMGGAPEIEVRAMLTARDERRPVYLNSQGNFVGVSSRVLQVKAGKNKDGKQTLVEEIRLSNVNQVNLFGAVQISTQAVQTLLSESIPLLYFTFGGWYRGMTRADSLKNIFWRREQFRLADNPLFCLQVAKELVRGKIRNQRTLLMRNHIEPDKRVLRDLKEAVARVDRMSSLGELRGLEGYAARIYFQEFAGMLKAPLRPTRGSPWSFDFRGRNRRPPKDPVNALLSLAYSLLAKDLAIVSSSIGLDPQLGFFHQPRFGRPALALDLMEPFRPLIAESAVLTAVNQGMVTEQDFLQSGDAVALTASGRKGFFRAYENRMDQLVTHPQFDYRVSYRRVLEIQSRLLARVLLGEVWPYRAMVTR